MINGDITRSAAGLKRGIGRLLRWRRRGVKADGIPLVERVEII
jgi:hypothetical protein